MSNLMRDEPIPATDLAVYWVEHVLRHGGAKHLRTLAREIPFYQLYLLDVWLFFALVVIATFFVLRITIAWMIRKLTANNKKIKVP